MPLGRDEPPFSVDELRAEGARGAEAGAVLPAAEAVPGRGAGRGGEVGAFAREVGAQLVVGMDLLRPLGVAELPVAVDEREERGPLRERRGGLALEPQVGEAAVDDPAELVLERPLALQLDCVHAVRVDEERAGRAVRRGVDLRMRQQEAHRALLAGGESDAGVDRTVLREVRHGVVGGLGVRAAGRNVHREAHLAVGREVLDVEREPPGAGEVERASALGRIEAQAARPLGAAHAQPDGARALAHNLRAVDGDEAARGEGKGRLDRVDRVDRRSFRFFRFFRSFRPVRRRRRTWRGGAFVVRLVDEPPRHGGEDEEDEKDLHGFGGEEGRAISGNRGARRRCASCRRRRSRQSASRFQKARRRAVLRRNGRPQRTRRLPAARLRSGSSRRCASSG